MVRRSAATRSGATAGSRYGVPLSMASHLGEGEAAVLERADRLAESLGQVELVLGHLAAALPEVGPKHSGAPGIAHGGTVAALVDDVCGFLLFVVRKPAVTRKLEVEYLKPVLVGVRYDLVAKVDSFEGRKLFVSCEGRGPGGELTFRGGGLFLTVDVSHFDAGTSSREGEPPVAL